MGNSSQDTHQQTGPCSKYWSKNNPRSHEKYSNCNDGKNSRSWASWEQKTGKASHPCWNDEEAARPSNRLQDLTKNRLKRKGLNHLFKQHQKRQTDILIDNPELYERRNPSTWPQKRLLGEIRTNIPGITVKTYQSNIELKTLTMEEIDKIPGTLQCCRGSETVGKKTQKSSISLRLPFSIAVLDLWNTRWLTEETNGQHQWVGPVNEGCSAVDPCSYRHSGQWNRRSVGKGRQKKYHPSSHLSYKETRTLIRKRQKSTFIASIGGYNPQKDPLHQLSRHEQTTIFRLRTGHCGLKGHLIKIGIRPSALCDCGKIWQTPNHFLQSCPLYIRERQHIWPVSTTMDAKLWGSANDLHLITHFATLTGQRIWINQSNENKQMHQFAWHERPLP